MPGKDQLDKLVQSTKRVLSSGSPGTPRPPAPTPADAEQAAEDTQAED